MQDHLIFGKKLDIICLLSMLAIKEENLLKEKILIKLYMLLILIIVFLPILLAATDLSKPEDYLNAFMRIRGDASGKESVYHWTGKVYSFIPGEKRMELFGFEGYNLSRTVVKDGGFELLTREAAFFTDHRTGKILEEWRNPFTGNTIPVVQIWNDPVNQDLTFEAEYLPYIHQMLPSTDLGKTLVFYMDIFPFYPSPLNRKEHGEFAQSDTYQAAEFFQFFVDKDEINKPGLSSIHSDISWCRLSPWMPFMRMGDRPGNLVFVCRGTKLDGGFEKLPQHIQEYVMANKPIFASAPTEWTGPNETSWTFFKKLFESGEFK